MDLLRLLKQYRVATLTHLATLSQMPLSSVQLAWRSLADQVQDLGTLRHGPYTELRGKWFADGAFRTEKQSPSCLQTSRGIAVPRHPLWVTTVAQHLKIRYPQASVVTEWALRYKHGWISGKQRRQFCQKFITYVPDLLVHLPDLTSVRIEVQLGTKLGKAYWENMLFMCSDSHPIWYFTPDAIAPFIEKHFRSYCPADRRDRVRLFSFSTLFNS